MSSKRAFTLIELLIVVAIIAILAAIAVPNFLEAQVRAKASRAKNDMRTLATGIESYHVDWSAYPFPADERGVPAEPPFHNPHLYNGMLTPRLTSPTAYLSTLTEDPFSAPGDDHIPYFHFGSRVYDIAHHGHADSWDAFINALIPGGREVIPYYILSHGPDTDQDISAGHGITLEAHYDPSNGTISSGDIVYFGGSVGFLD